MRAKNLENANAVNPFFEMLAAGATSGQIKSLIVEVLAPYIRDKNFLIEHALAVFGPDAIRIGRLVTNEQWKQLLDCVLEVRATALRVEPKKCLEVYFFFEPHIRQAESSYALIAAMEQPKGELELDEFAFEAFRNIGAIIESVLQDFIREFFCLLCISRGVPFSLEVVLQLDLGGVIARTLELCVVDKLLATQDVRLSQWRNIAQHHNYKTTSVEITAWYGKNGERSITLSRENLLQVAKEVVARVAIFKGSREIELANNRVIFRPLLTVVANSLSSSATMISAAISTQGFKLVRLVDDDKNVAAEIADLTESEGFERVIHCAQFLAVVSGYFPGRDVEITYRTEAGNELWLLSITAADIQEVRKLNEPTGGFAEKVAFRQLTRRK
jgi:hypothetical protein